jgi:hypothetical protein
MREQGLEDPVFFGIQNGIAHSKYEHLRVKDRAGSELLGPLDARNSISEAREEELAESLEEAVDGRYSGDIEIVQ